jgi:asparagine synthase (glutamine-hydrolysing)
VSGFCGVVARREVPVDPAALERMIAAAPHRATGAVGRHAERHATLAQLQRRPLPPHGGAVTVDDATGVVVVADLRLDNAAELRRSLGADAPADDAGHASLVAAAYRRWDLECLPRLLGDFAIVVWDPRRRRLLLARDPMAMRALYYRVEGDRVLVATEVAQLLAVPGVPDAPDERMVAAYLAGNFGALDWTYYAGVSQVPPSHAVCLEAGMTRTWRYWDVDPGRRILYRTEREYADHLRELFLEAVRARIAGPQPAGVLLSGGVDSGAAASAAGWLLEREPLAPGLRTYSWDYGHRTECDERHISRHILERYAITGTDVPVADAGPLGGYPDHAPHVDDPFHGHFQTMLDRGFAQARGDGVGPLLTGMRGDLAIGPVDEDYGTLLRSRRWSELNGELRRHAAVSRESTASLARRYVLPAVVQTARSRSPVGWVRWATRRNGTARQAPPYPAWISADLARRVDLPALLAAYGDVDTPELEGPLRRRRYQWIFMPMHLRWAVSHERRVAGFDMQAVDAWSDRRVAEFCLAVPQQVIDRPFAVDKRLAREAMRGIMPDAFRREAGKTVPTPLYEETLRTRASATVRHLLTDSRAEAAGWLDSAALLGRYEAFAAGGTAPDELWWALSLEWWLRARRGR